MAPTTRPEARIGTASDAAACGTSFAPSGNTRRSSRGVLAYAGLPVRAAVAIGERVVSGRRRPGRNAARAAAPGSTITISSPSISPREPPDRTEQVRHERDERARDLGRSRSGRQRCRQLLEVLGCRGLALRLDRPLRFLAAQALKAPADPDEAERHDEADGPPPGDRVVVDRELPTRLFVEQKGNPGGRDRSVRRADAQEDGDEHDHAHERAS